MELVVVLVSGGLDSCVAFGIAAEEYEITALHISYGQRTEKRERLAFHKICDYYDARDRREVSLPSFSKNRNSALTDTNITMPVSELNNKKFL